MRTTVTLDPDAAALIQKAMRERGLSFKEAVNEAIRRGAGGGESSGPVGFPTHDMGEPLVDVTKALRLAGQLEDDELARRLSQGR